MNPSPRHAPGANVSGADRPRVLLVEDDPVSLEFLADALERLPATVDRADSLAAARRLAARHAHALWLIDAQLPDGRGVDLLAQLRADFAGTPALAHTASPERQGREALIEAGFLDVLLKPLPAATLRAAVCRALGHQVAIAAAACRGPPVWDDAAAMIALHGQRGHVDALRRLFLDELPAQHRAIADCAARDDAAGMRAALHRLRASCGFVGAARLDAAVRMLAADPGCALALQRFDAAATDLLLGKA